MTRINSWYIGYGAGAIDPNCVTAAVSEEIVDILRSNHRQNVFHKAPLAMQFTGNIVVIIHHAYEC